jgi:hypothetical protein
LVQSYTASLTSLLTVEQLRPTITDVNQLLKNKMNVGYLKGSFVYGILKNLGFPDSQLITYQSPEECNELFIKGSVNGGIDAAFDEVPYLKHFLGTFSCSKYVMVEPRFKTGGFGYVSCFNSLSLSLSLINNNITILSFEQCFKNCNESVRTGYSLPICLISITFQTS